MILLGCSVSLLSRAFPISQPSFGLSNSFMPSLYRGALTEPSARGEPTPPAGSGPGTRVFVFPATSLPSAGSYGPYREALFICENGSTAVKR